MQWRSNQKTRYTTDSLPRSGLLEQTGEGGATNPAFIEGNVTCAARLSSIVIGLQLLEIGPLLFPHQFKHHPDDADALSRIATVSVSFRFRLTRCGYVWAANASGRFHDDHASSLVRFPQLMEFVAGYPLSFNGVPRFSDSTVLSLTQKITMGSFCLSGNSRITDESMAAISTLPNVRWLKVPHCNVTDDGVSCFAGSTQLLQLSLIGTSISDRSVETLLKLRNLTHLAVSETNISADAIAELSSKLPMCRIL